jgi:hypothetical protein
MNETRAERPSDDPDVIDEILEEHAQVDGDIVKIDEQTWAIHGSIPVDGEVILGEFDRRESAEIALERLSEVERGASPPRVDGDAE